jgi:hypothetical protein
MNNRIASYLPGNQPQFVTPQVNELLRELADGAELPEGTPVVLVPNSVLEELFDQGVAHGREEWAADVGRMYWQGYTDGFLNRRWESFWCLVVGLAVGAAIIFILT